MEQILADDLAGLFRSVARVMAEKSEELGEMDARMGDGDLGLTMKKGFAALPPVLEEPGGPEIGAPLIRAGIKMASAVPSTMGTLMASGLLSAGKAVQNETALGASGFAALLAGFADGVAKRGKCEAGDRTVYDALRPAALQAAAAAQSGADLARTARAARDGARGGVEATRQMRPRFGKAAVFADQAPGTPDQGAYAALCLLEGLCNYICARDGNA